MTGQPMPMPWGGFRPRLWPQGCSYSGLWPSPPTAAAGTRSPTAGIRMPCWNRWTKKRLFPRCARFWTSCVPRPRKTRRKPPAILRPQKTDRRRIWTDTPPCPIFSGLCRPRENLPGRAFRIFRIFRFFPEGICPPHETAKAARKNFCPCPAREALTKMFLTLRKMPLRQSRMRQDRMRQCRMRQCRMCWGRMCQGRMLWKEMPGFLFLRPGRVRNFLRPQGWVGLCGALLLSVRMTEMTPEKRKTALPLPEKTVSRHPAPNLWQPLPTAAAKPF